MKGWETREGRQTGGEQGEEEEEEGCKVKKKNETRGDWGVNVIHTHQKKYITISIFVTRNLSFPTERGRSQKWSENMQHLY